MPHVPQPRADLLRHPDAVAGVAAHRRAEHRLDLPELKLHLRVALEAPAGEHNAAARRNGAPARHHARDPGMVAQQALHRRRQPHRYAAAPPHLLQHHLEQTRAVGRAAHQRKLLCRIEARHLLDIDEAERVGTGKRVVGHMIAHAHRRPARPCQLPDVIGEAGHALRQAAQHRLRRGTGVGRRQVGVGIRRTLGDAQPARRADRDAPRIGLLLQQQHRGAGIMGLDRRDRAGIAEADDDDVVRFVSAHKWHSRKRRTSSPHSAKPVFSRRWPSSGLTPKAG